MISYSDIIFSHFALQGDWMAMEVGSWERTCYTSIEFLDLIISSASAALYNT